MSQLKEQVIFLPAEFTQPNLADLKAVVDICLADGERVKLDGAGIERLDGASLQFLIACASLDAKQVSDDCLVQNSGALLHNAMKDIGASETIMSALFGSQHEQPTSTL